MGWPMMPLVQVICTARRIDLPTVDDTKPLKYFGIFYEMVELDCPLITQLDVADLRLLIKLAIYMPSVSLIHILQALFTSKTSDTLSVL